MLKFAKRLPTNKELAVVLDGQSNMRPWGHRDLEGYVAEPQLRLSAAGQQLDVLGMTATSALATIYVADVLASSYYVGAELRLIGSLLGNSTVNQRVGRALVLANAERTGTIASVDTGTETITTTAAHNLVAGDRVLFTTTGTLPGGLVANVAYYVIAAGLGALTFRVSVLSGGAAVNLTSAGTGTHSWRSGQLSVQWIGLASAALQAAAVVTLDGAANNVLLAAHTLQNGDRVTLDVVGGLLPDELMAGTVYFVIGVAAGTFQLSLTRGGTAIDFIGNGSGTITCTPRLGGYVHLAQTSLAFPVTMQNAGDTVTRVAHGLQNGDRAVFSVAGAGILAGGVTAGTTYYVVNRAADTFQIALTLGGAAIVLTSDSTATVVCTPTLSVAQVIGEPWKSYDNVRVLTPYQPEAPGAYPAGAPSVPGFTFPASITGYSDAALFLPFTWNEGIEGIGSSGSGTNVSYGANTLTHTGAGWTADMFVGAYVFSGNRTGVVISNTTDTLTLAADWVGGTPAAGSEYETGVPHWRDNPNRTLFGFRYPSNDMQPGDMSSIGNAYNRPRGRLAGSYVGADNTAGGVTTETHRFGMAIVTLMRIANALGRRINAILLGVNSAGQVSRNTNNAFGFQGQIGWWVDDEDLDWTPSNSDGLFARFTRMISVMAPAALTAEGNTKTLAVIGIGTMQGEADALVASAREIYDHTLTAFYDALRKVITDASLSPYSTSVKVPVVHGKITHAPWELSGTFTYYGLPIVFNGDGNGLVNAAIEKFAAVDGWAATFETDVDGNPLDATTYKLNGATLFGIDLGHFNGTGEARNGRNMADAMLTLVNAAIAAGNGDQRIVDICNLALSHLGDVAQLTSIEPPDGSAQATHCARYYPIARDSVLAMRPWSFAAKRVTLVEVTNTRTEWDHAYALPADVMTITAVTSSTATDDYSVSLAPVGVVFPSGVMVDHVGAYVPQDHVVEQDADGNRVLYTDQADATLRYQAFTVDPSLFSPLFVLAVSWQLAAMLAGPLLKGDQGAQEAKRATVMMVAFLGEASQTDANQKQAKPKIRTPWISGR